LFIDDFIESSFRLCPTDENAIDKEARCAADARTQAILVILLNLVLELFGRNACFESLRVQLQLRRLGDQAVVVQAALIRKKEVVILPELALRTVRPLLRPAQMDESALWACRETPAPPRPRALPAHSLG